MHTPPQPRVAPRPANASRATILICDDDAVLRAQFAKSLRRRDYDVLAVASVDDALDLIDSVDVDRAVVDLKMPERSGLELVEALARREPPIPCVVLTGYGSIATALEAVRLGATHYLTKPADVDEVLKALDEGLDMRRPEEAAAERTPSLARAEWEHINRVLADTGGNISEAARRLGLQRRTLQRKLKVPPPRE
ncbi:MAG: response regulator [Myxococcales bacterium]|nr:response regulator [Myxococcales bacterium]